MISILYWQIPFIKHLLFPLCVTRAERSRKSWLDFCGGLQRKEPKPAFTNICTPSVLDRLFKFFGHCVTSALLLEHNASRSRSWLLVYRMFLRLPSFSRLLPGKLVGPAAIHRLFQTNGLSSRSLLFLKAGSEEVPENYGMGRGGGGHCMEVEPPRSGEDGRQWGRKRSGKILTITSISKFWGQSAPPSEKTVASSSFVCGKVCSSLFSESRLSGSRGAAQGKMRLGWL